MNSEEGKLFVGGVSKVTTWSTLTSYFGKYGEVRDALIVYDKLTGNSRGFGFVTFIDPLAVEEALKEEKHFIQGKKVDVFRAKPKNRNQDEQEQNNGAIENGTVVNGNANEVRTKKIFVGGLPRDLTKEEFKNFFEHFGVIDDAVVMYDKVTKRPRGFGFVTFNSEDSADMVLENRYHKLKGYDVEVKRAVPKEENDKNIYTYNCEVGALSHVLFYNIYAWCGQLSPSIYWWNSSSYYNNDFCSSYVNGRAYTDDLTNGCGDMVNGISTPHGNSENDGGDMEAQSLKNSEAEGDNSSSLGCNGVKHHKEAEGQSSFTEDDGGEIKAIVMTNSAQVDDLSSLENNGVGHQKEADEQSRPQKGSRRAI